MRYKILHTILLLLLLSVYVNSQFLWTSRYGTASLQDEGVGIAISGSTLIVTGIRNTSNPDIVTMALNINTGDTLWVKIFAGATGGTDQPSHITFDNAGFVYISGWTFNPTRDMLLIKYDAATGDSVWVRRYNGPVNGGEYANYVSTDAAGNVYLTGRSDVGGAQRITTIKYNSSGAVQWTAVETPAGPGTFDQGNVVKADAAGNVYVAGSGQSRLNAVDSYDYILIKYNSAGVQQWFKRHNGNWDKEDIVVSMMLDNIPNVYVGGFSKRIGQEYDYVTIKYDGATGDSLAAHIYNNTGGLDAMTAMTIDASNNIYLTGYSQGIGSNADVATVKLNSSLAQQWVMRFVGTAGVNFPSSIAVSTDGHVYVNGSSSRAGNYDFLTIRYSSTGSELASLYYASPNNGNDYSRAMVLDSFSNVYVTGYATFGSNVDFITNKYTYTLLDVKKISENVPVKFNLYQNYPNPFNPLTTIKFDVNKSAGVQLVIYDAIGRVVETLINSNLSAGTYEVDFNAENLSSGIYFYELRTSEFRETKKMIINK